MGVLRSKRLRARGGTAACGRRETGTMDAAYGGGGARRPTDARKQGVGPVGALLHGFGL
jgi:hypothetical protein